MAESTEVDVWPGEWVTARLDVELVGDAGLRDLAGLAVRRNPKRAHLVVSPVLGKHVPVEPRLARARAEELGERAAALLDGRAEPLVLGYCETATGLGHCVADALGAPYLHSTRRCPPGRASVLDFEEKHSHATSHYLLPDDPGVLDQGGPIVLVDDEMTTGATVINTIRAIEERSHHEQYVVAALLDLRPAAAVAELDACAAELGVRIDVVSLGRGEVLVPADVLVRGSELVASLPLAPDSAPADRRGRVRRLDLSEVPGVPPVRHGGRHGFGMRDRVALDAALGPWVTALAALLGPGTVQVVGTEELMYLPLRLACGLAEERAAEGEDDRVTFSSTTRSPIAVVDEPGYAVRSVVRFPGHDGTDDAPRFAYNLGTGRFDHLVVVLDPDGDTPDAAAPGGVVDVLSRVTDDLVVLVLPAEAR